jgi:nucleoid DNA-binding protein
MSKVDLIQALKESNNLSKPEAETVVNLFFDQMVDALAKKWIALKSGVFFPFSLKNTLEIPAETPKPARR